MLAPVVSVVLPGCPERGLLLGAISPVARARWRGSAMTAWGRSISIRRTVLFVSSNQPAHWTIDFRSTSHRIYISSRMTGSALGRAVDVVHKGAVLGLFSFFGFQMYQIGAQVYSQQFDSPYMHSTYFDDVKDKVKEEYRKDNVIDQRDWYQKEDDSYLKDQVRANITRPDFRK